MNAGFHLRGFIGWETCTLARDQAAPGKRGDSAGAEKEITSTSIVPGKIPAELRRQSSRTDPAAVPFKAAAEFHAGTERAGFGRDQGDSQQIGNFLRGQVLHVAQREDVAEKRWNAMDLRPRDSATSFLPSCSSGLSPLSPGSGFAASSPVIASTT
jgi:hypothetical protein